MKNVKDKSSLSHLILTLFSQLLGGAVVGSFLLDQLGLPVRPWSVGVVLGVVAALSIRQKPDIKVDFSELVVFSAIVLGVLAYCLWLGRPNQLPVGTTVDAVHQEGLADYINQSGQLPIKATHLRANLMDGIEYPPAFVILVSLSSQLTGLDPIYLLHPVASFFLALALGTTFLIICTLIQGQRRVPLAALATGFCLLPFGYTFGSFTDQTYFAQVTGNGFLILAFYFLLDWQRRRAVKTLLILIMLSSALIICYPTYFLIFFFSFIIIELCAFRLSLKERLVSSIMLALPVGIVLFLFLQNRLLVGLDTLSNEGAVLSPDLSRSGWIIVGLAGVGVLFGLVSRQPSHKLIILFCGLVVAEGLGLWLLKQFSTKGSLYAVFKQFYLSPFLIPMLATIGLNGILSLLVGFTHQNSHSNKLRSAWLAGVGGIILFGTFLTANWLSHPEAERPFPVFTRDIVEVAYWTRDNLKPKEYEIVYSTLPGTIPYWLDVGIFKFPRNQHALDLLQGSAINFESWLNQPDSPKYFFTDNIAALKTDKVVTILCRSGNVAVLTRSAAYKAAQAKVSLQYKAEFKGNRLELRTEAALSEEPTKWLSVGLGIEYANQGEWVFSAFAPAEEGRVSRTQFLGTVVELPSLEIKELYSNNTFPPKSTAQSALAPGHYISYLLLKKKDTIVEKIPLLEFDFLSENRLKPDSQKQALSGYLLYQNLESQSKALLTAPLVMVSTPAFRLNVQPLQLEAKPSENIEVSTTWSVAKDTVLNYKLRWYWLDFNQQMAGDFTLSPEYPTWLWSPDTIISLTQKIPPPNKPGSYQLAVALIEPNSTSEPQPTHLDIFVKIT